MPLTKLEDFGTEVDGPPSNTYCTYCYQNGAFTVPNTTLEEMIELSAKGWSDADPNITYDQAKVQMKQVLPYLARWRTT
jgi:hypothetical protein